MAPKLLPKDSPTAPSNSNWKRTKLLESERKKRERLNRRNLNLNLKRAQQPGAGLGGRAFGLLNKRDGILSKSESPIKIPARTPNQKSVTSVLDESENQFQSNEIEMGDQADLVGDLSLTEGEEAIKAFINQIYLGIDILQERMRKLWEENVIAKQLLQGQAEVKKKNHEKWSERQKRIDNAWDAKREDLMAAFIIHEAPEVLCPSCDLNHHITRPFHNRQCMKLDSCLPLKPTHFLDADVLDVPVPLFCQEECSNCGDNGTLKCQAGTKSIAVITRD
ncbi:Uncharacterized protein APZ42_011989, partial [Daphnia magna]